MAGRTPQFLDARAWLALLLACGFAWACYAAQAGNPWCCDFGSYVGIAHQYTLRGLIADTSGTRLYGYPAIVAASLWLGRLVRADLLGLLYVLQFGTYMVAVIGFSHHVWRRYSGLAGRAFFFALVGNVFIYPYLTVPLADGVSVAALVFAAWAACRIVDAHMRDAGRTGPVVLAWLALGGVLGFAVMLRPANIGWIGAALPLGVLAARRGGAWAIVSLAAFVSGYGLAVAPQAWLNWQHFDRIGFLPPRDIGTEQLQWGLKWIKYGTQLDPLDKLTYLNPFAPAGPAGLEWYFKGMEGVRLFALRMAAAIDIDHLFPYVTSVGGARDQAVRSLAHAVAFWGVAGLWALGARVRRDGRIDARVATFLACIVLFVLAWAAVHATTAYENRFSLPVIALLLPAAAMRIATLRLRERRGQWLAGAFLVYMALWWPLSIYLSSLLR